MSRTNPTASEVIAAADAALESDNRHDESANKIWEAVKPHIPAAKRIKAAKALADAMQTSWESYLENVTD
jgi:hypothetical protein